MQYWRTEPRIGGLWSAVGQEAANFKIFLKRSLNQTPFPPLLHAAWMAGTLSRCYYFSKQLKKWFTILCFIACFHVSRHTQGDVRYPHWSKMAELTPWSQTSTGWTIWSSWGIYWCLFFQSQASDSAPAIPKRRPGTKKSRAKIFSCLVICTQKPKRYTHNNWCKWFIPLSQTEDMSSFMSHFRCSNLKVLHAEGTFS